MCLSGIPVRRRTGRRSCWSKTNLSHTVWKTHGKPAGWVHIAKQHIRNGVSVQLSAQQMRRTDRLRVTVTVKNTGTVGGSEVVQMYLADVNGSVARPVRELRGFCKVRLEPGEESEVSFEITEEMLRFHDIHMDYVSEPGVFRVFVGDCSELMLLMKNLLPNLLSHHPRQT